MKQLLSGVERALRRLERSDSPVKRRNARLAFKRALRALERGADGAYRPLRDDGSEVARAKRRGVACPYCKVPFRGLSVLLKHLRERHGWLPKIYGICKCGACGKAFTSEPRLVRHLAAYPDLGVHVAVSNLKQAAEPPAE